MAGQDHSAVRSGIDPTQNVRELVEASVRRLDDLRVAAEKWTEAELRHRKEVADIREQHAQQLRTLESDRVDKTRQGDLLAINAVAATGSATAAALATQLTSIVNPLIERVANLERLSYEGQGRSKVADPAMVALVDEVRKLTASRDSGAGKTEGSADTWKIIAAALGMAVAVMTIYMFLGSRTPQPVVGVEPPPVHVTPSP